jgi:subtilase family serine protease
MKKQSFLSLAVIAAVFTAFFISNGIATAAPEVASSQTKTGKKYHTAVCTDRGKDDVICHARVVTDQVGTPVASKVLPTGYGPAEFLGAYELSGKAASPKIIAIIDAYDHPTIQSDLDTYSRTFGIPKLPACRSSIVSSKVPCFKKVDQYGGTNYPKFDAAWALEIALDVEVAHAICQNCKILLVEAKSATYDDMMTAVDRAIVMGATVISNSYGSGEFPGQTAYDYHFNRPGIAFTVSSGDSGYVPQYPAASPYVTAVGGTTLFVNENNTYQSESVWNGTGSGCSAYSSKPSWQTDTLCATRMIADVSAVADPGTGAAVYTTADFHGGYRGWLTVGGTSLSAPLIAGVYALAGDVSSAIPANQLPYTRIKTANIHDIQIGSNGYCDGSYLCTAGIGYDGPTGLGSPKGIAAF